MTPPHSVLSRSSTRHLNDRPCLAASKRPTRSPYSGAAAGATSCLARCHSAGSCHAAMPSRAARSSSASRSTPSSSAMPRSASLSRARKRAREPGRRCSLLPSSGRMHRQRGLLDDRAAERVARQAPGLADAALDLVQRRVGAGDVQARGDAGGQVVAVQRQQDRGGLEGMQRRVRIGQFLRGTGRNRFRRCRSRCRGAGRRRGSPAADAPAWRTRAPPGAPAWWPVPPAWPGTRGAPSRPARWSARNSAARWQERRLPARRRRDPRGRGTCAQSAQARAPVGDGRQPVQFGHVAYSLGRVPWGCSWRKWPDFAAGQRFAGALAGE